MSKSQSKTLSQAVGEAVRAKRLELGWTQDAVSEQLHNFGLDWDRAAVARLEAGKRGLTFAQALQLLLVLDLRAADLVAADADTVVEFAPGHRIRGDLLRAQIDPTLRKDIRPGGVNDPPALDTPLVRRAARVLGPGEAERKAARRLGATVEDLMAVSNRLWGQRLSHEREARLSRLELGADQDTRAVRGHLTRQLLAELAAEMEQTR